MISLHLQDPRCARISMFPQTLDFLIFGEILLLRAIEFFFQHRDGVFVFLVISVEFFLEFLDQIPFMIVLLFLRFLPLGLASLSVLVIHLVLMDMDRPFLLLVHKLVLCFAIFAELLLIFLEFLLKFFRLVLDPLVPTLGVSERNLQQVELPNTSLSGLLGFLKLLPLLPNRLSVDLMLLVCSLILVLQFCNQAFGLLKIIMIMHV
mmetsp:Transcript_11179/g.22461  ORF Transcript_11179/g.22461 Transcript_11179/m.22461 type:complete len:206 (+) Transcript_11179:748-1365(+)